MSIKYSIFEQYTNHSVQIILFFAVLEKKKSSNVRLTLDRPVTWSRKSFKLGTTTTWRFAGPTYTAFSVILRLWYATRRTIRRNTLSNRLRRRRK